jgi:hypothetical protein
MIRIIGDIHGDYNTYLNLCKDAEYSVQVGDLGYNNRVFAELDPSKHKFITGNHDNHDKDYPLANCLGRYGYHSFSKNQRFFFISGGFSIDYKFRTALYYTGQYPKTYFDNEELSYQEMYSCEKLWREIKPMNLISHEAPRSIVKNFSNPEILLNFGFDPNTFTTKTSEFLDHLYSIHKPANHFFGHYHRKWEATINGTNFYLIPEKGYIDVA